MTKSDALPKAERLALDGLADGPARSPKGVGPVTLTNLLKRGWIDRAGYDDKGHALYALTPVGREQR